MASPTIKLNSGAEMPQVGFGLWKVDNPVCADTVYNAIKAGYRLFDGACGESKRFIFLIHWRGAVGGGGAHDVGRVSV